jgi:flavin reductase (DIM6/NTAB) family NADH-FMN oxidoreductase RutF
VNQKSKLSFKDVVSLVSTGVYVLTFLDNNLVFSCTISSLVSVDIQEDNPEVLFVLKKDSYFGGKIMSSNFFTINVLSSVQGDLAQKYSTPRDPEIVSESNWQIDKEFVEIRGCRSVINCQLSKVYDSHSADIFIGSVLSYSGDAEKSALLYDARSYGIFESFNQ